MRFTLALGCCFRPHVFIQQMSMNPCINPLLQKESKTKKERVRHVKLAMYKGILTRPRPDELLLPLQSPDQFLPAAA